MFMDTAGQASCDDAGRWWAFGNKNSVINWIGGLGDHLTRRRRVLVKRSRVACISKVTFASTFAQLTSRSIVSGASRSWRWRSCWSSFQKSRNSIPPRFICVTRLSQSSHARQRENNKQTARVGRLEGRRSRLEPGQVNWFREVEWKGWCR